MKPELVSNLAQCFVPSLCELDKPKIWTRSDPGFESRFLDYSGFGSKVKKRSKVKEIIVLIKARSFLDELNLEHLTS